MLKTFLDSIPFNGNVLKRLLEVHETVEQDNIFKRFLDTKHKNRNLSTRILSPSIIRYKLMSNNNLGRKNIISELGLLN